MGKLHRYCSAATILLLAMVSTVQAGFLAGDANAMPAYKGTVQFSAMGIENLLANVDFAVYSPGSFASSFPGLDPSSGTHYVYAYQIFNDLEPHPVESYITRLSVQVQPGIPKGNVTFINGTYHEPSTYAAAYSSVGWNFQNEGSFTQLNYGQVSEILIFTSPYQPGWKSASVSGVTSDSDTLPSPVPEPALAGLALLAGVVYGLRRNRS